MIIHFFGRFDGFSGDWRDTKRVMEEIKSQYEEQ